MRNISHIFIILSLIAYALASGFYVHAFPKVAQRQKTLKAGFAFLILATIFQTVVIAVSREYGQYTYLSSLVLINAFSWITIASFFILRMKMLGTFVAPFATLLLILQFFMAPRQPHVAEVAKMPLAEAHILFAILGEAFAIVACAISILYLFQERALKKKQLSRITSATPPIDKLDRIHIGTLWTGFGFITLGLISGAIYTRYFLQPNVPNIFIGKIVWAVAVWIWYLAILLARNIFSLSGRRISIMSLCGFLLLTVAWFGLGTGAAG